MQVYINLGIVTLITFFFNMPWGYWRASVKKFSWKWFLAVHLPIPVIIFMRFYFKLGFQLYTYPFLVGAFFLGQFVGARYYKKRKAVNRSRSIVSTGSHTSITGFLYFLLSCVKKS